MRKATKFVVTILLILLVSSMVMVLVGCDNFKDPNKDLDEDTKPVYQIKLYDDNWDELPIHEIYGIYEHYEVEYDGTQKGVNAKCFIDDEEFYRYDYREKRLYKRQIPVSVLIKGNSSSPIERGEYDISFEFDMMLRGGAWYTVSGKTVGYSDLPNNVYTHIKLIIV